jgi:PPOX class probable F420-dependent enzyme
MDRRMEAELMRRRLGEARVGMLATAGPDGAPHLVPICFALEGEIVYWAVDFKPKAGPDLKRLRNLAANPRAALLVDHQEEDWDRLWWVRADCSAALVEQGEEAERAISLLAAKYPQYARRRPGGPVVRMRIERWSGWSGGETRAEP